MKENRMTYEEFQDHVAGHLKEYLPEDYREAEVSLIEINKANETGISLRVQRPGDNIIPSINLDRHYEDYNMGKSLDRVMSDITSYLGTPVPEFPVPDFHDYEAVKDTLFIRVCDLQANQKFLEDMPHEEVDGLAMTAHLLLQKGGKDHDSMLSAPVTKAMFGPWGITEKELFEDARENSSRILPVKSMPIADMLAAMSAGMGFPMPDHEPGGETIPMIIVTNDQQIDGASAMFYPGVMDRMSEMAGGDLYILPSSRHEVIILPERAAGDRRELEGIVRYVNMTAVEQKDRLSDNVYYYDAKDQILEKAETHERRMTRKEKEAKKDNRTKADRKQDRPEKRSVLGRLNEKKEEAQKAGRERGKNRARSGQLAL